MVQRSSLAKGRATFATTVSRVLGQAGYGRFVERRSQGTAFGGFKAHADRITGMVSLFYRPGSDMDYAPDEDREAERAEMIAAYRKVLEGKGYEVTGEGSVLYIRQPETTKGI